MVTVYFSVSVTCSCYVGA